MPVSTAVGLERRAKVVGYQLEKGNFGNLTENLPQRIAIFGQANTANQGSIDNTPFQFTSADEVGNKYGFGSQLHIIARIIRGLNSDIVGGIPTWIYPQLEAGGAAARVQTITVTGGPATAAGVIAVTINGRSIIDGFTLNVAIASGDAVGDIATKIRDAINNCLPCSVSATAAAGVVTCTTKWRGASAQNSNIEILTEDTVGMAYAVAQTQAAAGDSTAEINSSLALFGNAWNTIVVNPYLKATNALFEAVNGIPGVVPGTGRYGATTWKPFICFTGDVTADTVANVLNGLSNADATIVQCAAPNSKGWPFEAAANVAALVARQAQDEPHLDASEKTYLDMPIPIDEDEGVFGDYNNRDLLVKGGASTVIINAGKFQIEDLITTYAPAGENPPQFSYVRTLIQDFNFRYAILVKEQENVIGKAIIANDKIPRVSNTVKPDQWKGVLFKLYEELEEKSIIVDAEFSKANTEVAIGENNPDRFETSIDYKRSGFSRIASTTATAGFNLAG